MQTPAPDQDIAAAIADRVRAAAEQGQPLYIVGGNSKAFYGRRPRGEPLEIGAHRGIVAYEPTELVITARAGTPLRTVEAVLAEQGQMLPFEPPAFGAGATLGGTVACNLSGPRRPYSGAARDFVLGTKVVNGKGERLSFGGEVMKNVAGYDVSRLMAGAMGTLGVLLEISLKVLPRPETELTLVQRSDPARALETMHAWARRPLPLSATCFDPGDSVLGVRLSGTPDGVRAAREQIGGDPLPDGTGFWQGLKEHRHPFFRAEPPLWRLAVPSATPPMDIPGQWLYEWGGGQRWLLGDAPAESLWEAARRAGGHATLFRGEAKNGEVFQPLPAAMMQVHRRIKDSFDPKGILNPGRLYPDL